MDTLYENTSKFVDDIGTIYEKVDDEFYDYKLEDEFGIDYCTIDQMIEWQVKVVKKLEE